jgi:hypothetical protein
MELKPLSGCSGCMCPIDNALTDNGRRAKWTYSRSSRLSGHNHIFWGSLPDRRSYSPNGDECFGGDLPPVDGGRTRPTSGLPTTRKRVPRSLCLPFLDDLKHDATGFARECSSDAIFNHRRDIVSVLNPLN